MPGSGSLSTWDFTATHNYCYCYLSYFGSQYAKGIVDRFWERVDYHGLDQNPYRLGYLQLVVVSETDAPAEKEYEQHIKYFYDKSLWMPFRLAMAPGYQDYDSMVNTIKRMGGERGREPGPVEGLEVYGRYPQKVCKQSGGVPSV